MDEGARVEIELTEHPDAGGRRRRGRRTASAEPRAVAGVTPSGAGSSPAPSFGAPPADAVVTSGIDPGEPARPDRGRLVATAAAVGLVALVAGWALGRAGGDSARTVDATPTTERERPADPTTTVLAGETVPAASVPTTRPPSTTRPPRTTTTTVAPAWTESSIAVDPRLADATDRIVAVTDDRELIELDLATGAVRSLPVASSRLRVDVPLSLVAGDDWTVIRTDDGRAPLLVRSDDPVPGQAGGSDQWATFWQADTSTYWVTEYDTTVGYPILLREHDLDGRPTGRTIDTHGLWTQMPDPAGGMIVADTSGVYRATPDGSRRIAEGRPVALGVGHVVSYACGDTLDDCGLWVTDRSTGSMRRVPYAIDAPYSLDSWWGALTATPEVTADGGAMLAVTADPRTGAQTPVMIDLGTGEETVFESPSVTFPPSFVNGVSAFWSQDGRFAFVLIDGLLVAHERATGERFVVSSELLELRAVTRRQPPRPDAL